MEHMISACSKRMFPSPRSPHHYFRTSVELRTLSLTVKMSNSDPRTVQLHPWVLILAAKVGRCFDSFPGATEQKSEIFPLQLGTTHTHTRHVKHRGELTVIQIIRDAQRWTHAQKHLPCLIGSVTFSGLSCLPYLPDTMEREGSEEERLRHKEKVLLITPQRRKSEYCKFSYKGRYLSQLSWH